MEKVNMIDEVDFYLEDLKSKFKKIEPQKYYLLYSGGKDSHLLYWFIKKWLYDNDFEMWCEYHDIPVVGVNTYMEHPDILFRIHKNSDIVLRPELKPYEIKEKYGSPCFSKWQDDMIDRYQRGSRRPYLFKVINSENENGEKLQTKFKLNKTAKERLLNGTLHKISPKCCEYLKKRPARKYEKQTGRKPILGVRGDESQLRQKNYKSCFTKSGKFTPLWDLTDELEKKIYEKYNIDIPPIYNHISRTGCMGCVYGSHYGNTEKELALLKPNQLKFVIDYFKESYDVLGINYQKYLDEYKEQKK